MASTTPDLDFRYPVSTDKIAIGAQNIEDLADDVEDNTIVATNKFVATDPHTGYPIGASTMAVSNANGWPYGGIVHTIRRLGGSYTMQLFVFQTASVSRLGTWIRYGFSTSAGDLTWSQWRPISDAGTPKSQASGRVTITPPSGGGAKSATVLFPSGRFVAGTEAGAIRMSVTASTNDPQSSGVGFGGAHTDSVVIYFYRSSATATGIDWIATQGLEPGTG